MSDKHECGCGCHGPAVWLVESVGIDGKPFAEPACRSAEAYLAECAAEFRYPYTKRPIGDSNE